MDISFQASIFQVGVQFSAHSNTLLTESEAFAQRFGASPLAASGSLSVYNCAVLLGSIGTGFLVDRLHITHVIALLSAGAGIAVFLAWGFASSFAGLCIFSVLYGLSAGGWSSTWVGVSLEIRKDTPRADVGILWGFAAAARGIGSVASGPISEALVATGYWDGKAIASYGTPYGLLIVFTGSMITAGSIGWFAQSVRLLHVKSET